MRKVNSERKREEDLKRAYCQQYIYNEMVVIVLNKIETDDYISPVILYSSLNNPALGGYVRLLKGPGPARDCPVPNVRCRSLDSIVLSAGDPAALGRKALEPTYRRL